MNLTKTGFLISFCILVIFSNNLVPVRSQSIDQNNLSINTKGILFEEPTITETELGHEFIIHETNNQMIPGHPSVPVRTFSILLGQDETLVNISVNHKSIQLEGFYNITATPNPVYNETLNGLIIKDPTIYSNNCFYPPSIYEYEIKQGINYKTLEKEKKLVFHLYPIRYNSVSGNVIFSSEMNITITTRFTDKKEPAPLTTVLNQQDLLIITNSTLRPYATQLSDYKNSIGIKSYVEIIENIYDNNYGVDKPEKIRNYIKKEAQEKDIKFVIIFGDADVVPVRYVYIPDEAITDGHFVETDLYYADFQYSWDDNYDGLWGDIENDSIDGVPDILIGRLPVTLEYYAQKIVDKIIAYETYNRFDDPWFNRILFVGTDPFDTPGAEGEILHDFIETNLVWDNFTVRKLYRTFGEQTIENLQSELSKGYGIVNYAGHGNADSWYLGADWWIFPIQYTSEDSDLLRNGAYKQSVIITMACLTSQFADYECFGEYIINNPYGGAIAYFGSTRIAWGYSGYGIVDGLAGEMAWRLNQAFFDGNNLLGAVWGQAVTDYIESNFLFNKNIFDWKTIAGYGSPFIDPTMMIAGRNVEEREKIALVSVSPYEDYTTDDLDYLNYPYDVFNESNINSLFENIDDYDNIVVGYFAASSTGYEIESSIIENSFIDNNVILANFLSRGGSLVVLSQWDYTWLPDQVAQYLDLGSRNGGEINVYAPDAFEFPIHLDRFKDDYTNIQDPDLYRTHFQTWENEPISTSKGVLTSSIIDYWSFSSDVTTCLEGQYGDGYILITTMELDYISESASSQDMPFFEERILLDNFFWKATSKSHTTIKNIIPNPTDPYLLLLDRNGSLYNISLNGDINGIDDVSNYQNSFDYYQNKIYYEVSDGFKVFNLDGVFIKDIPSSYYCIEFTVISEDKIALFDNDGDNIYFINSDGDLLNSVNFHASDSHLQNMAGITVGDKLIVSEDGNNNLLYVDINTYECGVFRELSDISTWLGAIDYYEGVYYICGPRAIYRFNNATDPIELIATLPDYNIVGLCINGDYAYTAMNFGAKLYRIDLNSGVFNEIAAGFYYPEDMDIVQSLARAPVNITGRDYAVYSAWVGNETHVQFLGWDGIEYYETSDPHLINASRKQSIYNEYYVAWYTINVTNRHSVDWIWWPYWFETGNTIGDTITVLDGNGTITRDTIVHINNVDLDCWVLQYDNYTFTYDKETGILVSVRLSDENEFWNLTLASTNVIDIGMPSRTWGNPNVSFSPNYGAPGATIVVSGYNFTPMSDVTLYLNGTENGVSLVSTTTSFNGSFTTSFTVPAVSFQNYPIYAIDENNGTTIETFKVGIIAIIISPTSGYPGTEVTLTGTGFTPGWYNASLGNVTVIELGVVDAEETLSDVFTVPSLPPDTYSLTVVDGSGNELAVTYTVLFSDIEEGLDAITKIGVIIPSDSSMDTAVPLVSKAETDINNYMEEHGYNVTFEFLMDNAKESAAIHLEKVQGFKAIDVNLLVAGGWSSQAHGSLSYINENNMLILSPSSTSPILTIADDNLFRLSPDSEQIVAVISEMLFSADIEAVVIMQRIDPWADGITNALETEYTQLGGNISSIIEYPVETADYSSYLAQADDAIGSLITEYGVDNVGLLILSFSEAATIATQAEEYPNLWSVNWFGSDGTALSNRIRDDASAQADHLKILSPYLAPLNNTKYRILDEWYISEVGYSLQFYTANWYDACWVLALSAVEANSSNALDVKPVLPTVAANYEGITGLCTLNDAGDRDEMNYDIWGYGIVDGTPAHIKNGYYNGTSGEVQWIIDLGTPSETVVQWNVTMTVNASGYTSDVTFGVKDGATYLFDAEAGDMPPSPDPPTGVSAYFHYPDNPLYQGFLDTTKLSTSLIPVEYPAVWTLKAKSIGVTGTATWHWNASDIASIPSDLHVTLVTPSGSIDMRSTNQCQGMSIDADTTYTFTIVVTSEVEYTMELRAGWNMVSLPVTPTDVSASSVLDGISFYQLVTWSGTGYVTATDFDTGRGYWLLVLEDVNVTVTGIPVDQVSMTLSPGWSMIGGPNSVVTASEVFPGFYQLVTWTGTGYTPATVFDPGKGYWALVLTETQIQLPPT